MELIHDEKLETSDNSFILKDLRKTMLVQNAVSFAEEDRKKQEIEEVVQIIRDSCSKISQIKDRRLDMTGKRPSIPTGRRPWTLVEGIDYDLDLDDIAALGELDEELIEVDQEELFETVHRRINEKYEFDSFCCQDGYLSDEEYFESPSATREQKRQLVMKMREASEKKKRKSKLDKLTEPELLGVEFCTAKGNARPIFKKWNGLVVSSLPIPTGISIGRELLRQAITEINSGKSEEAMIESDTTSPVLPLLLPNPLLEQQAQLETNPSGPSQASTAGRADHGQANQELTKKDNTLMSLIEKYNAKYMIKKKVSEFFMDSPGITLENLTDKLGSSPDVCAIDEKMVLKYTTKYYFKFRYLN